MAAGDLLAEVKGLFGLFTSRVVSPADGTIEFASAATGHIGIRREPTPVEVTAFMKGCVAEAKPPDTVVIESRAALVQGVFGVGGEVTGNVVCPVAGPDGSLSVSDLPEDLTGKIVIGGAWAEVDAWQTLVERQAAGLVVGTLRDSELRNYLGYDLGLAITGHEDVPFPVMVTDGFGHIAMSETTFELLRSLEGRAASMTGQTQIRAGAVRPELVSPLGEDAAPTPPAGAEGAVLGAAAGELEVGSRVRLIRHPHFGLVGRVAELPDGVAAIATGARVRVLVAELDGGEKLLVPRSNVELFGGAGE